MQQVSDYPRQRESRRLQTVFVMGPFVLLLGIACSFGVAGLARILILVITVAKRSADLASVAASQPTRFLTPDSSAPLESQIALNADPSSAHFVPPDYTVFWLGMIVAALGLIAVLAGIIVVLIKRRMA